MRRLSGQAALVCVRLLHWAAGLALLLVILAGVGVTLLGWRLAQGPMELPWLVHRIEASVNTEDKSTQLSIGGAALAWEGFSKGVDRPLDLRLRAVNVTDDSGARLISIPNTEVSLSLLGLLFGRIEPRGIEIENASVRVFRSATGDISLGLGALSDAADAPGPPPANQPGIGLRALVAEFGKPASTDFSPMHSRFGQLRRVRIENASVIVVDRQLGATWRAPQAEIDLTRHEAGGVDGHADLTVALGDQTARVAVAAMLAEGGRSTHVRAGITPVAPAALARAAPALSPLSALSAPVGATATLDLGPTLALQQARLTVQVGAGDLHVGSATIPVTDGALVVTATPDRMAVEQARLAFEGHDGAPVSVLSATGTISRRRQTHLQTQLAVLLDQVAFADLPTLWPQGMGAGARAWITENITAGTARNGHVDVALDIEPDFFRRDADRRARHAGRRRADGALAAADPADRPRCGAVADRRSRHAADRGAIRTSAAGGRQGRQQRRAGGARRYSAHHRPDAARPDRQNRRQHRRPAE